MAGKNCQVFSLKHLGIEELAHDFLWRTTGCLLEPGQIGIFKHAYYEQVLIVGVQPEILQCET